MWYVLLSETMTPSFLHMMLVAGDPDDVQFKENTEPEPVLSPSGVIDTGAMKKIRSKQAKLK